MVCLNLFFYVIIFLCAYSSMDRASDFNRSLVLETMRVYGAKFRETLMGNANGNPERSPKGNVQRLYGSSLSPKRYGKEKVQTTNFLKRKAEKSVVVS